MLSKDEVKERVIYCYLVFRQLGWLYANSSISPADYVRYIQASSLLLGEDGFIMARMEDASRVGNIEEIIREIIAFYEGMVFALATTLEMEIANIEQQVPAETLKKLAQEMGIDYCATP